MQYMVIERFKNGQIVAVYERFDECGRMMPDGLNYVSSWISDDLCVCYQLMETADRSLFDQWTGRWDDLVDFEIVPVISSSEARIRVKQQQL